MAQIHSCSEFTWRDAIVYFCDRKDTLMLWLGLKLKGSGCNFYCSHFPGGSGMKSTSCLLYGLCLCFAIETTVCITLDQKIDKVLDKELK